VPSAKVSEGGRVVIPTELRARHGIAIGDSLLWVEDGQGLRLVQPRTALRRVQQLAARYKRPGVDEVDEFIRDKRSEVAHE